MIVFGRSFIKLMHKIQGGGQPISENVPLQHRKKAGTPSMGGILILIAIFVASLLFMPMHNMTGWIALSSLLMFGTIGFIDDYLKTVKRKSDGLLAWQKFLLQLVVTTGLCLYLIFLTDVKFTLLIPFAGI